MKKAKHGLTEDQPTANRVVSSPESNGGPTNAGETSESDDDGEEEEVKMNDSLETLRDSSRNSSQNSLQDWYTECQVGFISRQIAASSAARSAKAAAEKAAKHAETWTEFAERKTHYEIILVSSVRNSAEAVDRLTHMGQWKQRAPRLRRKRRENPVIVRRMITMNFTMRTNKVRE